MTVRNGLVTLEQGKQFRAQAIPARCGKGVHGEKRDHDSETPWRSHRASDTFAAWSANSAANTPFHDPEIPHRLKRPPGPNAVSIQKQKSECIARPRSIVSRKWHAHWPHFLANPCKEPDMNINAMWALYSSIIPPIGIYQPNGKIVDLHQEQSDVVKARKSVETNSDLISAKILRITNEIARSS